MIRALFGILRVLSLGRTIRQGPGAVTRYAVRQTAHRGLASVLRRLLR